MTDVAVGTPFGQADLTTCDREIIHLPGCIQAHGTLLVLSPDLVVEQVGGDTAALFGVAPLDLLGRPLATLVDARRRESLAQELAGPDLERSPIGLSVVAIGPAGTLLELSAHRIDDALVLELEPIADGDHPEGSATVVKLLLDEVHRATDLATLSAAVARRVRQLTGFERVWVYRFHPDDHGEVIAEDKIDALPPFLGLHYPATDIPLPARQLFLKSWIRLIHDADAVPSDLLPAENPRTGRPLDMSHCVLRAVSPIHIEYLKNMGVRSTMSISLIDQGRLWGLISCNARRPIHVSIGVRATCELIARTTSLVLSSIDAKQDADYKLRLRERTVETIEALTLTDDIMASLPGQAARLADFVQAGGFALVMGDGVHTVGATPDEQAIRDLVAWLGRRVDGPIWSTDALAETDPPADSLVDVSAGLLAVQVATLGQIYLLWFRPEQVRTVSWGGDPEKERRFTPPGARLHPRKSFEIWKETVKGRAAPWLSFEVEAARDLRTALLNVVLRLATEVELLNRELARSNDELDAFAYVASHDLKKPLRGIHNYSVMMMEDLGDDLPPDGRRRLEAIARLTQRMEALLDALLQYSRLGRHELALNAVDLGSLMADVEATLATRLQETGTILTVDGGLPSVGGDPILLHELMVNLVSNAIKYNDKDHRRVEVGVMPGEQVPGEHDADEIVVFVRDNGIGIPPARFDSIFQIFRRLHARGAYGGGTGVGLTIARKIVERHGGRLWLESSLGEGSTFYVALPRPGRSA